ncbi:Gfo/Idh/MocA family protein [Candidatus Omnitrophota bacterium]
MRNLNVGIIGLGMGEEHLAGYRRHPACRVVALCDLSKKKLAAAKRKYPGIRLTQRSDELLKDHSIDVISIASYDNYHYEHVSKALANDKHVFVEKPLCLYEKQARRIRSILRDRPALKMSSNLLLRGSPRFRLLKRMIRNKELGRLYYIEGDYNYGRLHKITDGWRGAIDYYSVVYGGGVHIVDLMLWMTGDTVVEVSSYGNNISARGTRFKYNDAVVSILRFKSGMTGKVSCNFGCVYPHFHPFSLYGTKATFINGRRRAELYRSSDPKRSPKVITAAYPGVKKGNMGYNFIDSIIKKNRPIVSANDIFKTMSVCFAIERSVNKKSNIRVNYI